MMYGNKEEKDFTIFSATQQDDIVKFENWNARAQRDIPNNRFFSAEDVHHHVWGTFLHNLEQKTKKCKFNDSTSKKQKTQIFTHVLSLES